MRMHSKASENHSRFEVKRIKSESLRREVLIICTLINMPGALNICSLINIFNQ